MCTEVTAGRPLAHQYTNEDLGLLKKGVCNMQHMVRTAMKFGVKVVVGVNRFVFGKFLFFQGGDGREIEKKKKKGKNEEMLKF